MMSYLQNILVNGSWSFVLIAVAFAGAVSSLSSCTLARLPVMWGYVVATSESRKKGFFLSMSFACGLIVSYSILGFMFGVITDLASQLVQISQYLYFSLGVVLVVGGLLFAGLLPSGKGWFSRHCDATIKQTKNLHSAFLFGMFFAFLEMPTCPCCGAVLMVIASLVVIKGSLLYSGLVFMSFAVGQSVPILVIGFSSSILKHLLSRTQRFEEIISFVAGNILITSGLFLIMLS
ncbi:cytochrome c biogenesis protein CcdA [Patescibacteria group bacterium]|nr:cytochrome c biogenesis protein CcdA [Patescibacteria group bacterium]